MTLMLLFVSSWVAIYLARGIATPIKALAEASKEIARGNLSHRVTTIAEDELALAGPLVQPDDRAARRESQPH